MTNHHRLLLCGLFLGVSGLASADALYTINVQTSSLAGTSGSLDFEFNPGGSISQAASLQVTGLSGGSLAGSPSLMGDVSGSLPGTLTFDNGSQINDYFQGITYGSSLSFNVRLYGAAVNAPDGISNAGSTFLFSIFSDTAGTVPALTSDTAQGYAYTIDVNLDGTTTPTSYLLNGGTTTPEPGTFGLVGMLLFAIGVLTRRRSRSC